MKLSEQHFNKMNAVVSSVQTLGLMKSVRDISDDLKEEGFDEDEIKSYLALQVIKMIY